MNYGELKAQVEAWSQRSDLGPKMGEFVQNASQRLGRRFGVMPAPLVADSDTNSLLTTHSNLYLYATLREQAAYTHNVEAVQAYEMLYQTEVSDMNINYRGLDWDSCDSPVMTPVVPTEEAA